MEQQMYSTEYDEISLRELIEILLDGKWIIAISTIVFLVLGVFYAQFIVHPAYETEVVLALTQVDSEEVKDKNQFTQLVEDLAEHPEIQLDTCKNQVESPIVLNAVVQELRLSEKFGINHSKLASMISIKVPKDSNRMHVVVTNDNPKLAAEIANTVGEKYVSFINETLHGQTGKSLEFIRTQLVKEQENVDQVTDKLTDFLIQPRGVVELEHELSSKLLQLTEFKTRVTQLRIDIESTEATLKQAKLTVQTTPTTLTTTRSTTFMRQDNIGTSDEDIVKVEVGEEINPAYKSLLLNIKNDEIELARYTTQLSCLQKEIKIRQKEIDELQAELALKKNKYELLNYEVALAKETQVAYHRMYKEESIMQSAKKGRASMIILQTAQEPSRPKNSKLFITALTGVLGFMIGVFIVFFIAYWKASGKE